MLNEILTILLKFKSPENTLILGYSLLTFTSIAEGQLRKGNEEYGLKFFSLYMPQLSNLLTFITSQYQFKTTFEMHYLPNNEVNNDKNINTSEDLNNIPSQLPKNSGTMNEKSSSPTSSSKTGTITTNSSNNNNNNNGVYDAILNAPLLPLNPAYEFLSQCSIQIN